MLALQWAVIDRLWSIVAIHAGVEQTYADALGPMCLITLTSECRRSAPSESGLIIEGIAEEAERPHGVL